MGQNEECQLTKKPKRKNRCRFQKGAQQVNSQEQGSSLLVNDKDIVTAPILQQNNQSKKRKRSGQVNDEAKDAKKSELVIEPEGQEDICAAETNDQEMFVQTAVHEEQPVDMLDSVVGASTLAAQASGLTDTSVLTAALFEGNAPVEELLQDAEIKEPVPPETSAFMVSNVDSLKQLLCYGSGSQTTSDTNDSDKVTLPSNEPPSASKTTTLPYHKNEESTTDKITSRNPAAMCKKTLSFADNQVKVSTVHTEEAGSKNNASTEMKSTPVKHATNVTLQMSPTGRRPITRSMSPNRTPIAVNTSPSPRRPTRFATAEARASRNTLDSTPVETPGTSKVQSSTSIANNSMSRRLELDFESERNHSETKEQRNRRELIESYPSFDLGFNGPDTQATACVTETQQKDTMVEEAVVISSNEDSGDLYDKIFSSIDMPDKTYECGKADEVQQVLGSPKDPRSCTPVPQAHKKRVVKAGNAQKSPFIEYDKKPVSTKFTNEIYSKVCAHGAKRKSEMNGEKIIDYGSFYIYLADLADAVRDGNWLSNSTCEVALHVLSKEVAQQRKHVMSLRMVTKLRSPTCIHDRMVKKAFENKPENRLDHKEMIMFGVLQDLTPDIKDFTGHYYLIVLNLMAERFKVMDSLRAEGNPGLVQDYETIIGSIKAMWAMNYSDSKFKVETFRTVHIPTPMQKTTYDCGYFMLKFIESWDGRKMLSFNPADMPIFRKLYTKKWLEWEENKIEWQELLF